MRVVLEISKQQKYQFPVSRIELAIKLADMHQTVITRLERELRERYAQTHNTDSRKRKRENLVMEVQPGKKPRTVTMPSIVRS